MSLKTMLDSRSTGQAGALLNGSDIPAGTKSITIEVAEVREAQVCQFFCVSGSGFVFGMGLQGKGVPSPAHRYRNRVS